jgi:hypothetical protein
MHNPSSLVVQLFDQEALMMKDNHAVAGKKNGWCGGAMDDFKPLGSQTWM